VYGFAAALSFAAPLADRDRDARNRAEPLRRRA
jgi:hypothetical protein